MNIQGFSPSFDMRSLEPRRTPARESAIPLKAEPAVQSPFGKDNGKLPPVLTGIHNNTAASQESRLSDETSGISADEPDAESAERLEEIDDFSSDYEPPAERSEDRNEQDDQSDEQRQKKGCQLNALEEQYRSRLLILDQLIDRLIATHDFLTQQIKDPPS